MRLQVCYVAYHNNVRAQASREWVHASKYKASFTSRIISYISLKEGRNAQH
jgi:hypothetical protein